jgi:hypothetical protein
MMAHMDAAAAGAKPPAVDPRDRELFDGVRAYCMFIGIGRSGHSLVGSLLDAHPDAMIAHELDALAYFEAGLDRDQVFTLIMENARRFTEAGRKARWSGYDYEVPGGWHGRFAALRVIGDKRGGASTRRLRHSPELIDRVREVVGVPVRVVHAIRNPYDNIASKHKRHPRRSLDKMMREYFRACRTNAELKRRLGDGVLDLRHEDLMASPRDRLTELCRFVGLEPSAEYLDACARMLYSEPHRSRHDVPWSPELLAEVQRRIGKYDFLAGYDFES